MSDNLGRTGWLFLIDGPVCKPSCSISGLQCECWWCEGRRFCLGFQPGPQCPSSSPQVRTSVYAHMHRCAQFGAECGSLWLEVSGTGGMGSDRVWCAQKGGGCSRVRRCTGLCRAMCTCLTGLLFSSTAKCRTADGPGASSAKVLGAFTAIQIHPVETFFCAA